jgi:hypothetical protein
MRQRRLEGRVLPASYMPQQGHPSYEPMLKEVRRMFETHQQGGRVRMEYTMWIYYAQLA